MDPGLSMSLFKSPDYAQEVYLSFVHLLMMRVRNKLLKLDCNPGVAMAGQAWRYTYTKGALQASSKHLHHQNRQRACCTAFAAFVWQAGKWQLCSHFQH